MANSSFIPGITLTSTDNTTSVLPSTSPADDRTCAAATLLKEELGPRFKLSRIFSEPSIQLNKIEKPKWRTKRVKRQRIDSTSSATSNISTASAFPSTSSSPWPPTNSLSLDLNDDSNPADQQVYRPTTAPANRKLTLDDPATPEIDTMPSSVRYRDGFSEIHPLRDDYDDMSLDSDQVRVNRWRRKTTIAWALGLGVIAISVFAIAGGLGVLLEYSNAGNAVNVTNVSLSEANAPKLLLKQASPTVVVNPNGIIPSKAETGSQANSIFHNDVDKLKKGKFPLPDSAPRKSQGEKFRAIFKSSPAATSNFADSSSKTATDKTVHFIPIPILFQPQQQQVNISVSPEAVSEALQVGKSALSARDDVEQAIYGKGFTAKSGFPGHYYSIATRWTSSELVNITKIGYLMVKATESLKTLLNLTKEQIQQGIPLPEEAKVFEEGSCGSETAPICDQDQVYRSHDGSCNNAVNSLWGSSLQPYRRILYPDYADGVGKPRQSKLGPSLPPARVITSTVFKEDLVGQHNHPNASLLMAFWGQFVTHDIAYSPSSVGFNNSAIACCVNGQPVSSQHPECYALEIPASDSTYGPLGQTCLNFVRSAPYGSCSQFGPREQINQVTAYLDASYLYGSTNTEFRSAISYSDPMNVGRLPMTSVLDDGRPFPKRSTNLEDGCNTPDAVDRREFCFNTVDKRMNEFTTITAFYTIFGRHHNFVADALNALNPHWNHSKTYDEARRIVIAQVQHITYKEYLPALLGPSLCLLVDLIPHTSGYYSGYDESVDPGISNAFSAAAFRAVGHSMVPGVIAMVGPKGKNEDFIQLHKLMYNPIRVYGLNHIENLIRGHSEQAAGKADMYFSPQLKEHLFQFKNHTTGLDLISADIQRGRDHGLPSYLEFRKICNLTEILSFEDLKAIWDPEDVAKVSELYSSVQDIDLYVGGLAERPIPDGMLGPTFACIVADQFVRLRRGDKYWYENAVQPKPFTPAQLQAIRQTSLSQILCANTDSLGEIQASSMLLPSSLNLVESCGSGANGLEASAFVAWKEDPTLTEFTLKATNVAFDDYADEQDRLDKVRSTHKTNTTAEEKDKEGKILLNFSPSKPTS